MEALPVMMVVLWVVVRVRDVGCRGRRRRGELVDQCPFSDGAKIVEEGWYFALLVVMVAVVVFVVVVDVIVVIAVWMMVIGEGLLLVVL